MYIHKLLIKKVQYLDWVVKILLFYAASDQPNDCIHQFSREKMNELARKTKNSSVRMSICILQSSSYKNSKFFVKGKLHLYQNNQLEKWFEIGVLAGSRSFTKNGEQGLRR